MGGEQQTCGRGLAAQAELPAMLAALFIALAENLDALIALISDTNPDGPVDAGADRTLEGVS